MDEADWLAMRFEEQRTHLRAVAYRMLGSLAAADDAVQNSWLRLSHADTLRHVDPGIEVISSHAAARHSRGPGHQNPPLSQAVL